MGLLRLVGSKNGYYILMVTLEKKALCALKSQLDGGSKVNSMASNYQTQKSSQCASKVNSMAVRRAKCLPMLGAFKT